MSISDPAQLLLRIPELRALADDHKIRRAIEAGDSFKVYRALVLARLWRRLPQHSDLLKTLSTQRRLFAKALQGKPALGQIAGVGLGFSTAKHGTDERDSDGSQIAVHGLILGPKLNLIPFGDYLIKKDDTGRPQVLAQLPSSLSGSAYALGLAGVLTALLLALPLSFYLQAHTHELIILNGFEVPLSVQLDGKNLRIPAQGRSSITLTTGKVSGIASYEQTVQIDRFEQNIVSSPRTSIWNIAGAAPLLHTTLIFPKPAWPASEQQAAPELYCGRQFIELEHIQYPFQPIPEILTPPKNASSIAVGQLTLAQPTGTPDLPGITLCSNHAFEHGQEKSMLAALQAQAQIHDWGMSYTRSAIAAARAISASAAIRVANLARQAKPDQLVYEQLVQEVREDAGEHAALLQEYAQKASRPGASAAENYLYAELISGTAGLNAMQEISQRFPRDPLILRSLVWRKAVHGDYLGAQLDLMRLRQIAPGAADSLLDTEVKILMAQGRGLEALRLLNAAVRDKTAAGRAGHAADFALVAKQIRADPEFWLKELPGAEKNADQLDFYRVRAGLRPLQDPKLHSAYVKLALALRNDPAQAIALAKSMNRQQLGSLSLDQLTLLFGATLSNGDSTLAASLRGMLNLSQAQTQLIQDFMRGQTVNLDELDLDPALQAAACFIRSRAPQLSQQERASWRNRATKTDVLRGVVSTAISQWPA